MLDKVVLQDDLVYMRPLQSDDFEALYHVAADPLIWEQHPNPDRYKKEVFQNFFEGAMESGGAYLIMNQLNGAVVGCTRFYDHKPEDASVMIGYTFFSRTVWGKGYNQSVKKLMMDYAFRFVEDIFFHVGENNTRSRIAMTRLGAELVGMETIAYYGEPDRVNCLFRIRRSAYLHS